jgi:mono/diheme cytochrome c family protein
MLFSKIMASDMADCYRRTTSTHRGGLVQPACGVVLVALLASPVARAGETAPRPIEQSSGAELYAQLCVSCHGTTGQGDGPVASSLKVKVADLTRISEGNGGKFPENKVREMIDGRAVLPAHGTREMPVWGYELEARSPARAPGRATAQAMTDRLVDYLRSIQK